MTMNKKRKEEASDVQPIQKIFNRYQKENES